MTFISLFYQFLELNYRHFYIITFISIKADNCGYTCSARASMGVMYTQRPSELCRSILRMANSAHMVFPLPVGAPTKTLSSLLYTALNTEENKKILI